MNFYKVIILGLVTTSLLMAQSHKVKESVNKILTIKKKGIDITVSNIHPMYIEQNSAKIFWDVSDYSTGQVVYGKTIDYGNLNTKETSFKYNHHEQLLRNLEAGTTYHYQVISEDSDGNKIVSDDHSFRTKSDGNDEIKLKVSNIHPMYIEQNSAKIFWDVSDYSTGQVEYGKTTDYGNLNTKETSFKYNHHEQQLKDLETGTTYHYRVISEDKNGKKIVSKDYTFSTLGEGYTELGTYVPQLYSNNKKADNRYIAYYPENGIDADMPVMMFIKGGGVATIESYQGIMKFMASKGYYVIGVDVNSYQSAYVTKYLEIALHEVINKHGLNASKLAIMGHSLGGGQAFYAMKKFQDDGYGDKGSLVLSIDGWFTFNMDKVDLNTLDTKVSFLKMNGVEGTGTDPRIDLKIWNLLTQSDKSFYTLPSTDHSYVAGDLDNILAKKDLLLTIGVLTDDALNGISNDIIPDENKASYDDIFNALKSEDSYKSGDCKGIHFNAITIIKNNDINYCNLLDEEKHYPNTTLLEARATDNTIPRPTVGNPSIDNIFGTQIKMVDKTGSSASPYPKVQAWNSDMTLIRIKFRLYNAMTLEESSITKGLEVGGRTGTYNKLCAPLSSDFRWSTKDPNKFYVLNSSLQLIEGHIVGDTTNCETILFDFKQNNFEQAAIGPGEGNIDFNDTYIALPVKKKGDNKIYIFLYDLEKKKKVWDTPKLYNAEGAHWEADGKYWNPTVLDWVSVSPSGKYIVINDSNTGMYRYDINFNNKRRLLFNDNGTIKSRGGHGDIGFDTNGNEVFVQFIGGGSTTDKGVYSFNLDNPDEKGIRLLAGGFDGGFVSCRNILHKGWCYVSTKEIGHQEIFALKLDGIPNKMVQRFTQTHGTYLGGVVSPDGTKVLFSNKWGSDRLDTFVAEANVQE